MNKIAGFYSLEQDLSEKKSDSENLLKKMKAAQEQGVGDAIIKGLICYEFVSSNISSLIRIREQHAENMSGVGIVCDVEQVPFVRLFFTNFPEIKIRALSTNKINQFIFGREDVL